MAGYAWRRYGAECLGTGVLVLGGVGSAVLAGERIGATGIALAFGLALVALVYALGPVSGCHLNPAVTLGALLCRRMAARDAPGYLGAQVLGAVVGAGSVLLIANGAPGGYDAATAGLGANGYGAHSPAGYDLGAALLAEILLTAVLVFTVLAATDVAAPVGFAGLAIGVVLVLIHLVSIPVTATSVNPARSIGPALFVGGWALQQLWLFIVAPVVGGALAAGLYRLLYPTVTPLLVQEAEQALPSEQAERLP